MHLMNTLPGGPRLFDHLETWYARAHGVNLCHVEVGQQYRFLFFDFGEDVAPGIDDAGVTAPVRIGALAAAVGGHYEELVLDGAGAQEGTPVLQARVRPFGGHP